MQSGAAHSTLEGRRGSVFRAGRIVFDESRLELLVDGERRPLEAKPMAVLHTLLLRAGALAGRRELLEAVWGNADHISEQSLTTAISKLRTALGEKARDVVHVVPGQGYRIAVPVEVSAAGGARLALAFRPGDTVPGRPQWRLEAVLGGAATNDVWLARHGKTREARVFKFADSEARLETLRREAALSRVLHATLGDRGDLVRIVEWNFEDRPYFIESPYGGPDLPAWAASAGGLGALSLPVRLGMLAQIARTVGAAHAAGVLHGDIKPSNVLVDGDAGEAGVPRLKLVDFGAGGMSDAQRLAALAISVRGLADDLGARGTGTLLYTAPEVLTGAVPTTAADIYALGILLYQMAVGDFQQTLAVGWEHHIADEMLREDIAAAAAGDPALRLAQPIMLAERLETLDTRRAALAQRRAAAAPAAALEHKAAQARLRRPWVAAAGISLAAGLALSAVFGWQAVRDRDEARRRAATAQAVNAFLTEDLLGLGNPAQSGKADEPLMAAAETAEASIARRLPTEPEVAGAIYLSLARAFDSRSASDSARVAYDNAVGAFRKAGDEPSAVVAQLHEAAMEALSVQPGSLETARRMIDQVAPRVAGLGKRAAEAGVWLLNARALVQMLGGDARGAQAGYTAAADRAEAMPGVFDESTVLELRQRQAFTHMRLHDWPGAEHLIRELLARRLALNGPVHPDTLLVTLNLAQVRIARGDPAGALAELNRIAPDFVSVYGPDHRVTLVFLATRAEAFSKLQRYAEAQADQMTIYRLAVAKRGEHSYFAIGTLADASQSQCRAGDIEGGIAAARTAHEAAVAAFGVKYPLTSVAAVDLAFCLIRAGKYAEASPLLNDVDVKPVAELTMDPDYGAELDVMRAAIAVGAGDIAAGRALAAKTAPVFARADGDAFMRDWARRLQGGRAESVREEIP